MARQQPTEAWGTKLHEAQTLRKQGASMLHQRVKLLVEIHRDSEFQAWCVENSITALDYLDDHLEDVGFDFITLESVLRSHPTAEEWQKHNIRQLCAMVKESQRKAKEPVERINWRKRAEDLERDNAILKARLEEMEKMVELIKR
jgi:hypothetical protein